MSAPAADELGYFEGALREVNFFGGRLLAGRDLADEQAAWGARDAALATALGSGVAQGLVVRQARGANGTRLDAVDVSPGTAIAQDGSLLRLAEPLRIRLVPDDGATPAGPLGPGEFRLCGPRPTAPPTPTLRFGTGLQVLTIGPAERLSSEQAPGVAGADGARLNRCNARWRLHGVRFRLATVPAAALPASLLLLLAGDQPLRRHQLRHRVAALCLGHAATDAAWADPLNGLHQAGGERGLLAAVPRAPGEVPLALVAWSASGVAFVDLWAVRRGLHRAAGPVDGPLPQAPRHAAEAFATTRQFAAQLADLVAEPTLDPAAMEARQVFEWLPPAGWLPLAQGGRRGFDAERFFAGLGASPVLTVDAAGIGPVMQAALAHPRLPLVPEPPRLIWRLRVRENLQAAGAQACLAFAAGHLPVPVEARFNRGRYGFARYDAVL
jgi:hypothetical protein